jgi:hypothetical protein
VNVTSPVTVRPFKDEMVQVAETTVGTVNAAFSISVWKYTGGGE